LNYFLHLNKTLILIIITILIIILFVFISLKKNIFKVNIMESENTINNSSPYDILEPKFTINNKNKKIYVSANQGNFMKGNNVLLKEKVRFKSKDFIIYSDDVIFNQEKQTAVSKKNSVFISEKTQIKSQGFNISDNGNIIKFNGKSTLILTQ